MVLRAHGQARTAQENGPLTAIAFAALWLLAGALAALIWKGNTKMPSRVERDGNTYHTMKVWHPDRETKNVWTIASEEDHIGNEIAEGRMEESVFWPHMTKYYKARSAKAERKFAEYSWQLEIQAYNQNWVERWLADHETLASRR